MNSHQNNYYGNNKLQSTIVYTYHLPYAVRKEICNLLNADQTWRTLGGEFIGLDATQLTLIGQAYLRNASPAEELFSRLDSSNVKINDLCSYFKQINYCRALQILKPYSINQVLSQESRSFVKDDSRFGGGFASKISSQAGTLDTPTPSFIDQPPMAIMANTSDQMQAFFDNSQWFNQNQQILSKDKSRFESKNHNNSQVQQPSDCHKSQMKDYDPGEEIVRAACVNNRKRTNISDQDVVNQLRLILQIPYNELKLASNDFSDSNILGNGGFASVYRGSWMGTDVAIKRLKCNLVDQAFNELTILNSYRIDNILPIYGISIDGAEVCLVYQFMANGSLEDRISCKHDTRPLNWNQRALIGVGVAKGLYYLHTLRDKPLVHGDVKSANVLLDAQFVPKLGDFGLARQVFKSKNPQAELCTSCTVSSIHGTSVYLPPEYLRHKILSPAVDVYSYGIVLLEMATGRRAYNGKKLLIEMVDDEMRSMPPGQISYNLKDYRLVGDTQTDLKIWSELLIKLGMECAHMIKKKRPNIGQILNRFCEFRNKTGIPIDPNDNLAIDVQSINGTSTTRTLTPTQCTNEQMENNFKQPERFDNMRGKRWPSDSTALMSIEEDVNLGGLNGNFGEVVQDVASEVTRVPEESSVEAMIPLLTEFDIK